MDEVLLTFLCASRDVEAIVAALRAVSTEPIHVRDEDVNGLDYGDARAAEKVTGNLRRGAVVIVSPRQDADALIAAVDASRRTLPVRWRMTPLIARGRFA